MEVRRPDLCWGKVAGCGLGWWTGQRESSETAGAAGRVRLMAGTRAPTRKGVCQESQQDWGGGLVPRVLLPCLLPHPVTCEGRDLPPVYPRPGRGSLPTSHPHPDTAIRDRLLSILALPWERGATPGSGKPAARHTALMVQRP